MSLLLSADSTTQPVWNPFMHRNLYAKGFFSKIIILERILMAQKHISQKRAGFLKSSRSMAPPKIEK